MRVVVLSSTAFGGPMYSYVNEEGATVITDDLKKVPERYRKQVKVTESTRQTDESVTDRVEEALSGVWETMRGWKVPLPETNMISGLTNYQSAVLIGGFVIAALVFAIMALSQSPAIKFAMKWALMFVVVSMIYALYFSELDSIGGETPQTSTDPTTRPGTVIQRVKQKAKSFEQIHQQKANKLDRTGQP